MLKHVIRSGLVALLLIAGARCGGGGSDSAGGEGPSNRAFSCSQLKEGVGAGLSCIHCMHPRARSQSMKLIEIMHASCRRSLTTNYLIDGTFGTDDSFLVDHINSLGAERELDVVLYLANGPAQRQWRNNHRLGFGTTVSPETFRSQIQSDPGVREAYRQIVNRAMAVKSQLSPHIRVYLSPVLEDNLSDSAFKSMLELTRSIAGDSVGYVRSVCTGCYPGNGAQILPGVVREVHGVGYDPRSMANGMFSNDGSTYHFPWEAPVRNTVPLSSLKSDQTSSASSNTLYFLWTGRYQGIAQAGANPSSSHPDARTYAMPSDAETVALVQFLAH